jgi:hypothetical protein
MKQYGSMLARRRDVFATLLGGVVSVADITTTNAGAIDRADATDDGRKSGYHESEHVRTYYAVTRE